MYGPYKYEAKHYLQMCQPNNEVFFFMYCLMPLTVIVQIFPKGDTKTELKEQQIYCEDPVKIKENGSRCWWVSRSGHNAGLKSMNKKKERRKEDCMERASDS